MRPPDPARSAYPGTCEEHTAARLVVADAARAIDCYVEVFGAADAVAGRMVAAGGTVLSSGRPVDLFGHQWMVSQRSGTPEEANLIDLQTPWCVYTVATLKIAEHLAAGPATVGDLAAAAGCDADALHSCSGTWRPGESSRRRAPAASR